MASIRSAVVQEGFQVAFDTDATYHGLELPITLLCGFRLLRITEYPPPFPSGSAGSTRVHGGQSSPSRFGVYLEGYRNEDMAGFLCHLLLQSIRRIRVETTHHAPFNIPCPERNIRRNGSWGKNPAWHRCHR